MVVKTLSLQAGTTKTRQPLRVASVLLSLSLGALALSSCGGSDDDDGPKLGGAVGAACSADTQCTGYANPSCYSNVKPLENLVTSTDPKHQPLRDFTIPFPGGYCSSALQSSCVDDAACGDAGSCFRPFEGVAQTVIDNLNKAGLPFDIQAFSELGICLKPCQTSDDCRAEDGYECVVPLQVLVKAVDPTYEKKFCMQNIDVSFLLL